MQIGQVGNVALPVFYWFATVPAGLYLCNVNRALLGILMGLAIGSVAVLTMLPVKFPDRKTALLGAFASRFAIGFLAVNVLLPLPFALSGVVVGLLVSIPDAVITKTYAPIIVTGMIFGALAAWAGHAWGH